MDSKERYDMAKEFLARVDLNIRSKAAHKYPYTNNSDYDELVPSLRRNFEEAFLRELLDPNVLEYGQSVPTSDWSIKLTRQELYHSVYSSYIISDHSRIPVSPNVHDKRAAKAFINTYNAAKNAVRNYEIFEEIYPDALESVAKIFDGNNLDSIVLGEDSDKELRPARKLIKETMKQYEVPVRHILEEKFSELFPGWEHIYKKN